RLSLSRGNFRETAACDRRDLAGRPTTAADGEHHPRSEVDGDAGVIGQLGLFDDVRMVTPDDDYGITTTLDLVVTRDDLAERRLGIRVHLFVGHADAFVVSEIRRRVLQEQIEDVVAPLGRTRDRPEHTDPRPG